MDERVLCAAANNAEWCDLVCRSHGIPTAMTPDAWVALLRAPELYPDMVTLRPGVVAEDVLRSTQGGPGCAVKDSFADLDLDRLGFDELFEARWIVREPTPPVRTSPLTWTVVRTDEELAEWADAAGLAGIIRGDLLRHASVRVLAARDDDRIVGGAVANRTASVVGVSNVFTTTTTADAVWFSLPDAIAAVFPSLRLIGYEHGQALEAAFAGAFTPIGTLRVWLRPGQP